MKKALIIIISLAIVVLIVIWVYLLIEGPGDGEAPEQNTNFGSSPEASFAPQEQSDEGDSVIAIENQLTQLTTAPVAGAVIFTRDDERFVRYVERGTGHIYEIALATGEEVQVTGTTIPKVVGATWAPTGNRVAFTVETGPYSSSVYVVQISKNDDGDFSLDGVNVGDNVHSLAFDDIGDTLFYALSGEKETRGFSLNLKTEAREQMFAVPFTQIDVLWGDDIYVYNRPSSAVRGYVYRVAGGMLERVSEEGFGLMARAENDFVVVTRNDETGLPYTTAYDQETGSTTLLALSGLVSKCTPSRSVPAYLWCAETLSPPNRALPDLWHQGVVTLADTLVLVDLRTGGISLEVDFETELGYPLDGIELMADESDSYLIFKNKNDQTLWLYDATIYRE